jgi:hypothetical protein
LWLTGFAFDDSYLIVRFIPSFFPEEKSVSGKKVFYRIVGLLAFARKKHKETQRNTKNRKEKRKEAKRRCQLLQLPLLMGFLPLGCFKVFSWRH